MAPFFPRDPSVTQESLDALAKQQFEDVAATRRLGMPTRKSFAKVPACFGAIPTLCPSTVA